MRASCVASWTADAASAPARAAASTGCWSIRPCSGLGTLQSRPDLRWRATPEAIDELADAAVADPRRRAARVAPGGTLVYSVCTISRREGEMVLERFLREHPEFAADDLAERLPRVGARPRPGPHLQLLPEPRAEPTGSSSPAAGASEVRR